MLALAPQAASAQAGATAGVPMQAGSAWGHGAPPPVAYTPAPPTRMAPPPGAWQHGPAPEWHGGRGEYRRPTPGWKVPRHYRDRGYQLRQSFNLGYPIVKYYDYIYTYLPYGPLIQVGDYVYAFYSWTNYYQ